MVVERRGSGKSAGLTEERPHGKRLRQTEKTALGSERGSGLHRLCVQGHLLSKVGRDGSLRASVGPAGIQE